MIRRRWTVLAAAAVLLMLLAPAMSGSQQRAGGPDRAGAANHVHRLRIESRPIDRFEVAAPSRRRFGRLEFVGGLVLSSGFAGFGGLSGLDIAPDGRRFLAVSDETGWLSGEITYDGRVPSGIADARMGPLLGPGGRALERKRDRDAEALVIADGTVRDGTVLVGYERNHRIARHPVSDGAIGPAVSFLKLPSEAARFSDNKGFEAVGILRGGPLAGAVIAFAERYLDGDGNHSGWLWIDGEPRRLGLTNIAGFEVTDIKGLADGAILVLERRFRWTEGVRMRLRLIEAAAIKPGALLEGEVLIEADKAYEIDNMEGLAVHTGADGATVLTLISDDNFNHLLQRTVLLQFVLRAAK